MPQYALLNNIEHKDLRVITQKSAKYGDDVGGSFIFPEEFTEVQKEYPIFFQKDEQTGQFQAVAIFGFKQNENLFLSEAGWNARYIPAAMDREPFLIGFQKSREIPGEITPVIHVDMENPRLSKSGEGEPVFLPHGGNTQYLENISKTLMLIHEGVALNKEMFEAFLSLEIVEPFTLNIEFNSGEQYTSEAYYTINQEKFFALDDASLGKLHKAGFLHYAYMVLASLTNIPKLIEWRNQKK